MAAIISVREGPLAVFGESDGKTYVMVGENTAEARRQALLAKQYAESAAGDVGAGASLAEAWAAGTSPGGTGTKSAREYAQDLAGSSALIGTALQPGAPASALAETATAKVMTGAERSDIAAGLRQRKEISAGYEAPAFGFKSLAGRFVGLMRKDGRLVQAKPDGTYETVVSPSNRWGARALSIGMVAGEKATRVAYADTGAVVELFGANGSHWLASQGGGLVRANAGWFLDRETIWGRREISNGLLDGQMICRILYGPDGRIQEAFGRDGAHWLGTASGLIRANKGLTLDKDNVRGRRELSIGVVDGEKIVRVQYAPSGAVEEAWGINGGHFLPTATGLQRANASKFAAASQVPVVTYTGQAYTAAAQELLFRADQGVAYIFVEFGQSNVDGDNSNTADALISAAPLYPQNALMLDGTQGPRAQAIAGTATLVPLVEVNASASKRETPISGWVNHFIRDYYATWNAYPTVVGMSAAFGGRPYVGNNRGQPHWRAAEKALTLAAQALKARGFAAIEVVIGYGGSESDVDLARMTDTRFANQMRQFRRFAGELVRQAVNPLADPAVLFIQPSNVRGSSSAWFQPVRDTMVKLDREQGFTLAGSAYHVEMERLLGDNSNLASAAIHRSNLGKYTTGQILARATMHEVLGATWHGIKPVRAYSQSANVIAIEFDAMGDALVLDTSAAEVKTAGLANHGFVFDDGSGAPPAISSVAVAGLTVTITLASAPAGPRKRIGYALARSTGGPASNQDGPTYGARGTLRDNAGHTRISDGSTQYDWCPAFTLNL